MSLVLVALLSLSEPAHDVAATNLARASRIAALRDRDVVQCDAAEEGIRDRRFAHDVDAKLALAHALAKDGDDVRALEVLRGLVHRRVRGVRRGARRPAPLPREAAARAEEAEEKTRLRRLEAEFSGQQR